jgi:hypothetical protein
MGVIYVITPPTREVAVWLSESGENIAEDTAARWPLLPEIHEVLQSLDGFTVEYFGGGVGSFWQATVSSSNDRESGPWTCLNIIRQKHPAEPQEISFEKGYPELIVQIVSRLSARCGTLVIIPDTGCRPLVVSSGDDPQNLCANWEHLRSTSD